MGSRLRAFQRAIDEVVTPNSAKGWLKKRICRLKSSSFIFPLLEVVYNYVKYTDLICQMCQ